jgi:hypothetical protein
MSMLLFVTDKEAPVVHAEFRCWLPRVEFVVFGRHASSIEEKNVNMCLCGRQLEIIAGHRTNDRFSV